MAFFTYLQCRQSYVSTSGFGNHIAIFGCRLLSVAIIWEHFLKLAMVEKLPLWVQFNNAFSGTDL